MPPRWPRKPTRQDPDFRKLDDRYTLAAHVMIFVTVSLGIEFFNLLWRSEWPWVLPLTGGWFGLVIINALWVLWVARYPGSGQQDSSQE